MDNEEKIKLKILEDCIKSLNIFLDNADNCEFITIEEFNNFNEFLNKLENEKINLEIKIENQN